MKIEDLWMSLAQRRRLRRVSLGQFNLYLGYSRQQLIAIKFLLYLDDIQRLSARVSLMVVLELIRRQADL